MPAAAGCQHAGRRDGIFFSDRLKKTRRPVGSRSLAAASAPARSRAATLKEAAEST